MMKTKEEMLKQTLEMGLEMGATDCVAVLTAEDMKVLLTAFEPKKTNNVDKEVLKKEVVAQVYVDLIEKLIQELSRLGYDLTCNEEEGETFYDIEITHKEKIVNIVTW